MSYKQRSVIVYSSLLVIVVIAVVVLTIKNQATEFDKIEAAVPGWLNRSGR